MEQVLLFCVVRQVGDWTIRVDPARGSTPGSRKHVHVKKRGLKGEYSWNIDGTRHDKSRFPASEKYISAAKEHAAEALGVSSASLNFVLGEAGGVRVSIHANAPVNLTLFNMYIRVSRSLIVFSSPVGLIVVLVDDG